MALEHETIQNLPSIVFSQISDFVFANKGHFQHSFCPTRMPMLLFLHNKYLDLMVGCHIVDIVRRCVTNLPIQSFILQLNWLQIYHCGHKYNTVVAGTCSDG